MKILRPQWQMWALATVALASLVSAACRPTSGSLGTTCTGGSDCESGHCSAGVCCDTACDEPCYDCGDDGHCVPVISGQEDLDSSPMCPNPYVCDGSGNCIDGSIVNPCTTPEECDSGFCVDNACCESACNIMCMSCANAEGTCSSYVAAGLQDTNSTPTCVAPYACDGAGHCKLGNGESCAADDECGTGFCVDGICCESACEEPCMLCAGPEGTCTYFVAEGGQDFNADPPCVGDNACDGNGVCLAADGTLCGADTECISGFCVDGVCCESACETTCMSCDNPQGTCTSFVPDGDQDPNAVPPCDGNFHCNGAGACEEIGLAPGSACTAASECESGHCENNTCCMTACPVPCMSCANAQGTCTTFVAPFTEDPGACEAPNVCDGAGTCCENQSQVAQQLPVDIIFIIDNSGSMGQEILAVQNNINNNFASIIAASGLDYRVIMVARHGEDAGPESICIEAPLSGIPAGGCSPPPSQPVNTANFFHYSIEVASHNSLCMALDRFNLPDEFNLAPNGYSQWLRTNAYKVFIEITDDGISCSSTTGFGSFIDSDSIANGTTAGNNFDTALLSLSPTHFGTAANRNYVWYSIVCLANQANPTDPWLPTDPMTTAECSSGNCAGPGTGYQRLSILTGGLRFPICQYSAFDVVFNDIANNVVSSMACQYVIPPNVNPNAANLQYTPSSGPAELWPQVANAAACTGDQWYLDDPANPTLILLCPDACNRAQGDVGSQVEVLACVLD